MSDQDYNFDGVKLALAQIEKSINSFWEILKGHHRTHWDMVADYHAFYALLNDKLNNQVWMLEVPNLDEAGNSVITKEIDWATYRAIELNKIQEITNRQLEEARKKADEAATQHESN
jgi:hypothetical protein